jgi:hypothetical protein
VKSNLFKFRVKLAYLTNKCNNEDLDYYLKEVGDILGFIVFIFRD